MKCSNLQRSCGQRHRVASAHRFDAARALHDLGDASVYMNVAPGRAPVARMPELYGATANTAMPRRTQSGRNPSSAV
jgi:hypothetical protein